MFLYVADQLCGQGADAHFQYCGCSHEKVHTQAFPFSQTSGNIEKACDMRDWKYLGMRHYLVFGCNNVAGGLAAIRKLVFEDKTISLEEFCNAVENNFEGVYENARLMIEQKVLKFGNEGDYVDLISRDIILKVKEVCDHSIDIYGNPYLMDGTTAIFIRRFSFAMKGGLLCVIQGCFYWCYF